MSYYNLPSETTQKVLGIIPSAEELNEQYIKILETELLSFSKTIANRMIMAASHGETEISFMVQKFTSGAGEKHKERMKSILRDLGYQVHYDKRNIIIRW